jgi:hypothetical protein
MDTFPRKASWAAPSVQPDFKLIVVLRARADGAYTNVADFVHPSILTPESAALRVDSPTFFGGTNLGGNQSLAIAVSRGSAIVYGSTTDNTTNDPNIQFATAPFGIT